METLYTALHTALYTIVIYAVSYLAYIYIYSYRLWSAYKDKKDANKTATLFQEGYDLMDGAYRSGDVALVQDLFDKAMSAPDYNDFDRGIIKAYADCSDPSSTCAKLNIKEII